MLPKNTCTYTRTPYFKYNDTEKLLVKGWKKICHASTNQRKAEVATLISDKINIGAKKLLETKKNIV